MSGEASIAWDRMSRRKVLLKKLAGVAERVMALPFLKIGKHQKLGGQSTTPPSKNRLKSRRSTIDSVGGSRDFLLHYAH